MKNKVLIHGDTVTVWLRHKGEEIPCLIDASSLALAESFGRSWCLFVCGKGKRSGYAGFSKNPETGKGLILMHRVISAAPAGLVVDHISGDKLDNRKSNLRLATVSQNSLNKTGQNSKNTTGVRGVFVDKKRNGYRAAVGVGNRMTYCGVHPTIEAAALAVRARLLELGAPAENVIRTTTVGGAA